MKVLFVSKFLYRKGGSETYLFDLADALAQRGHSVSFFSMRDERNIPCDQERFFVSNRDYVGKTSLAQQVRQATSLVYSREAKAKFQQALEEIRPDVIHLNLVHRQITFSILDAKYLKTHPVPIVYTAHDYVPVCPNCTFLDGTGAICEECLAGSFSPCVRKRCVKHSLAKSALAASEARFLRWHGSYEKIDRYIAPSEFMKRKLVEGGFPERKITVMRNFLTAKAFEDLQRSHERERAFLYCGRISPEKGLANLLEAFAEACRKGLQGWRLILAGDGPDRAELEERSRTLGIEGKVAWLGHIAHDELCELIASVRYSVVPSVWYENAPYAVLESFAAGTPVLGSDIGGVSELIRAAATGITFNPKDRHDIASALLRAAGTEEDEYLALSDGCRSFAEHQCRQDRYLDDLLDIYGRLVAVKNGETDA